MKECRNLTVRHFKSSNVLAWRSLLVTETSRLDVSKGLMQARRLWENTPSEEALCQLFAPCVQRVEPGSDQR